MVCITLQRSKSRHECCFRFKNKLRSRLISRRTRGLAPQRRGWNLEVADEDGDDFEVRSGTGRCRRTAVSAAGPGHVPLPAGMSERSRRRHDCREIATGRCWTKRRARAGRAGPSRDSLWHGMLPHAGPTAGNVSRPLPAGFRRGAGDAAPARIWGRRRARRRGTLSPRAVGGICRAARARRGAACGAAAVAGGQGVVRRDSHLGVCWDL
jgi:hypothetical protein